MKNICVFCGAQVEAKTTRVIEEIGTEIMIVENVPAGVCKQCGEKEFAPDVVRHLEQICKKRVGVMTERLIPVAEYSKA